jgi:hypothetical protein
MRRLITVVLFIICFGIAGCSLSKPTTDELSEARQTHLEYPTNYQQLIKDYWQPRLVDPTAPIYEFTEPRKGYHTGGPLQKREITIGWVVAYRINSKNRMGGYTGSQGRRALIVDNKIRNESYDYSYGAMPSDNFIEYID